MATSVEVILMDDFSDKTRVAMKDECGFHVLIVDKRTHYTRLCTEDQVFVTRAANERR